MNRYQWAVKEEVPILPLDVADNGSRIDGAFRLTLAGLDPL